MSFFRGGLAVDRRGEGAAARSRYAVMPDEKHWAEKATSAGGERGRRCQDARQVDKRLQVGHLSVTDVQREGNAVLPGATVDPRINHKVVWCGMKELNVVFRAIRRWSRGVVCESGGGDSRRF